MNPSAPPREIRERIRRGEWTRPTSGLAPAFAQANLVILDRSLAFEFLLFCVHNPKPCPVLEVMEPGVWEPRITAPGADIRTDVPLYRVWRHGEPLVETQDIRPYWNDDLSLIHI